MCGIVSYIGEPTHPKVAYELTAALMKKTESRGTDATGFWASQIGGKSSSAVYYDKAPIRASEFINHRSEIWKKLSGVKTNLFIGHCRSSSEKGSENINKNNHPFLSDDKNTALVHNGKIPEFDVLRSSYDIRTSCDSEILLRILEMGSKYEDDYIKKELEDLVVSGDKKFKDLDQKLPQWSYRLMGMRDIFARINHGLMAVAVGERWGSLRGLWLFREDQRPLCVVDMRKQLGQVYIVSEPAIWRRAVESCPAARQIVSPDTKIIEFPSHYIWLLTVNGQNKFGFRKWKITRIKRHGASFENERPAKLRKIPAIATSQVKVITNLDKNDEPIKKKIQSNFANNSSQSESGTDQKSGTNGQSVSNHTNGYAGNVNGRFSSGKNAVEPEDWSFASKEKKGLEMEVKDNLSHEDVDKADKIADAISHTIRDAMLTIRGMVEREQLSQDQFMCFLEGIDELKKDADKYRDFIERFAYNSKQTAPV